jgi:hypothetical protein
MTEPRRSKRFSPSSFTEKLVPVFLIMLVLILLAVLVIIVLSLFGATPST